MRVDILQRKIVFDTYLKVVKETIRFSERKRIIKETDQYIVDRPNAAAALVYNVDTNEFLLVRQFRVATFQEYKGYIHEIVAGKVEEGETPDQCIKREVQEEIGYNVRNLEYIVSCYASPGYTTEQLYIYYAEVSDFDKATLQGDEADIDVVHIKENTALRMLENNTFIDAKTIIALQWYKDKKSHMNYEEK